MHQASNQSFSKIYVIQSLNIINSEKPTGKALYDSTIQYFPLRHNDIDVEFVDLNTKEEFLTCLRNIASDCREKGIKPLIHLEMHGLSNGSGLALNSGSVLWMELYDEFVTINDASKWNLTITMAVCQGCFAMTMLGLGKPAPYNSIIGSFNRISVGDLELRYEAFYQNLLDTMDIDKAVQALHSSNSVIPSDYRLISVEETFKNAYQKYFDERFSDKAIRDGFNSTVKSENYKFKNREEKHRFFLKFKELKFKNRQSFFEQHRDKYFMFDKYPENRTKYLVNWEPKFGKK